MKIPQCSGLLLIASAIVWPAQEEVASAPPRFRTIQVGAKDLADHCRQQSGVMAITSAEGMVRYGTAWHGMVWYGMVWYGMMIRRYGLV
jgi:hypothetical protein